MAKWKLPHELAPELVEEESTPTSIRGRFILPQNVPQQAAPVEETPEYQALMERGPVERVLLGAGERLGGMYLGAKQTAGLIKSKLTDKPSTWVAEADEQLRARAPVRAAMEKDPYATAGRIGTDVTVGMLPGAGLRRGALAGAALAGPLTPTPNRTLGDVMVESGKGALLGGAGGKLTNAGVSAVGKGVNVRRGLYKKPEYGERLALFDRWGVPASIGDITQQPSVMGLENVAQRIPGSGRREFLEQEAKALTDVLSRTPENVLGPVSARNKEDVADVLQRSIKEKYDLNRGEASNLYEDVNRLVHSTNAPPITPTVTQSTARQLLDDYPKIFDSFQDTKAVAKLRNIIADTGPQNTQILNKKGQPFTKPAEVAFDDMRWLDKRLGSMIRQGRQQMMAGKMDPQAFNQLTELQTALRKDVENWSNAIGSPEIAAGVQAANRVFREKVLPFRKNPVTKRVIQGDPVGTDVLASAFFKQDDPIRARQALQFLTDEGVQAGRYNLLKEAERRAINEMSDSGYSPAQFLRRTELGETGPILYSPEELARLDEMRQLVKLSRRAAGYAADADTGARLAMLSPLASVKIPLIARAFTKTAQADKPMRYLLARPDIVAGGLGRVAEQAVRRSGQGLGVNYEDLYGPEQP